MQETWESKAKEAQKNLKVLESEAADLAVQTGADLAQDPAYSGIKGWASAHAAWKEVDRVLEEIETAEYHAEEWNQAEESAQAARKAMAALEQKHRSALLALGRAAWKHLSQGSPSLGAHRDLFAEVAQLEERGRRRTEKSSGKTIGSGAAGLLQRVAAGAESALNHLQNAMEDGKKRSLLTVAGKELLLRGAAEQVMAGEPPGTFEALSADSESWLAAAAGLKTALEKQEDLKAYAVEGAFPFDVAVKKLWAQLERRETEAAPLYDVLFAAWEAAGFLPEPSASIKPLAEKREALRKRAAEAKIRWERAEAGVHAEKLAREAVRNRDKSETLLAESRKLAALAEEQEKEAASLRKKAGTAGVKSV